MSRQIDAIVIGAGAAGLMAATTLARAGQRVVILEARDRIGGRIFTQHHDVPLELGAEFVHGRPAVTCSLLHEAGLEDRELSGTPYRYADGRVNPAGDEPAIAFDTLESMSRWHAAQPPGTDVSFQSYLRIAGLAGVQADQARRYVEGFNAADQAKISVASLAKQQAAEDAIQADRLFHVSGGYDSLPRYLADSFLGAGGEIRLSHPVRSIDWHRHAVTVRGESPAFSLAAPKLIITVPLGVLKEEAIAFAPAVPGLRRLLASMEMGPVLRVVLLFRRPFWNSLSPDMLFLFSPGEVIPTWWTAHPDASPQITGWIGGSAALARCSGLRGEALIQSAVRQLAGMFQRSYSETLVDLVTAATHDWMADQWARGAYSYAAVGGVAASAGLARNIDQTLYFAGEHTDTEGHWGTVNAALASGQRAARAALSSA